MLVWNYSKGMRAKITRLRENKAHDIAFMGFSWSVQDYKLSPKVSCSHIEKIMKILIINFTFGPKYAWHSKVLFFIENRSFSCHVFWVIFPPSTFPIFSLLPFQSIPNPVMSLIKQQTNRVLRYNNKTIR